MKNLLYITTIVLLILKLSNNIQISYPLVFSPVILIMVGSIYNSVLTTIRTEQLKKQLNDLSKNLKK